MNNYSEQKTLATMQPQMTQGSTQAPDPFQFTSADGLSIACVEWGGHHEVRGVVQIAHGLGEHIGRYAELAETLVEAEFVVYGNDHRGHGLTAKPSGRFGDFGPGGFDLLVEDMVSLMAIAKKAHPGKPYILLGHSMGSFAAQQFVLDHSHAIDGLALSGSGTLDGLAGIARETPEREDPMKLMNAAFEPTRTPFDWLSRDSLAVDAFINDALCFPSLHARSMESFLKASLRLANEQELRKIRKDLSVYVFSGSDDPVGQRSEGVRELLARYRAAGVASITYDLYPGGRHEMLHELNRGAVLENLVAWIAKTLERSGAES